MSNPLTLGKIKQQSFSNKGDIGIGCKEFEYLTFQFINEIYPVRFTVKRNLREIDIWWCLLYSDWRIPLSLLGEEE